MNISTVENLRHRVYAKFYWFVGGGLCSLISLYLALKYVGVSDLLTSTALATTILLVTVLLDFLFDLRGELRGFRQMLPFTPAKVTFNHREFEVQSSDGTCVYAWKDVASVEDVAGSDVKVLRDAQGKAIFAYGNASTDTTKFCAWLNEFAVKDSVQASIS